MIHFIICDDEKIFIKRTIEIIHEVMMKKEEEYKIHDFTHYNEEFEKMILSKISLKIYILDIEVHKKSGIDIARKIRKTDINSMIIFCTAYFDKYAKKILTSKFMYLNFIEKGNNYKKELVDTLNYALKSIQKKNIIRFKSQNMVYTIATNDILYIMKEKDRKCTIYTVDNSHDVNKTLVEFKNMLGPEFVYSHRACLVNTDRIFGFDHKNRKIIFDNKKELNLVSARFKL